MLRKILIAPNLADPLGESVLTQPPAGLKEMATRSRVVRLHQLISQPVVESAWLGIPPESIKMAQGPLTVSALGHDPPERSVHFHLSLLSVDAQGILSEVLSPVSRQELDTIFQSVQRLATPTLTPLSGDGTDHALVWEKGSLDLGTTAPKDAAGKQWVAVLPEGDGESLLRRFIDDSINLLDGLELNSIRVDQGLPKLNILWPWGFGFRQPVPNLALHRGIVATYFSQDMRLQGLTRLAGYRHASRAGFMSGVHLSKGSILAWMKEPLPSVLLVPGIAQMREHGREEELEYSLRQWDEIIFQPAVSRTIEDQEMEIFILAPSFDGEGVAFHFNSHQKIDNSHPFDERIIEDKSVSLQRTEALVESALLQIAHT